MQGGEPSDASQSCLRLIVLKIPFEVQEEAVKLFVERDKFIQNLFGVLVSEKNLLRNQRGFYTNCEKDA